MTAAAHPTGILIGDDSFPTTQPASHGRRGAAGQPQEDFDVSINSLDHEQSFHQNGNKEPINDGKCSVYPKLKEM